MTTLRDITRRATIVTTALIVGLTASYAPSQAAEGEARTTITDHPGAPGTMLQQLEDLTGRPVGDLDKVLAVDTGGRNLTGEQLDALVAGKEVDGVKVVGTIPGSRDVLGTTMADLADGAYDGRGDGGTATSLLFASSTPDGREWCLTMCVASGKSIWECLLSRRTGELILTLDFAGSTTLGETKAAFEKANGVAIDGPDSVETLIGEGEPSEDDIKALLDGEDVPSLRRVATLNGPDPGWTLADLGGKSGDPHAEMKLRIVWFDVPILGRVAVVCRSYDDGKTWKCTAQQWTGFW
ncbi:hypothetical protein EV382_3676 [Micromonospora violae]|uniref:Uncharacterized protein n=1 Tax=Micromonospora violae TaxID=1278207 RepID=A0A4Q7UGG8_9ACTN|nr:hypothetical protein [Micromonospora violae]RZT80427.1 hypothetical protein EV382_3676 [Micromonospora violae]